jgi:methyl-accepting chemotaxis protein
MKTSIGVKLFFGFIIIIFLNIFYLVIIYKLSDLKDITHILKHYADSQQHLLQIANLHESRNRSRLSYNSISDPEKKQVLTGNFLRTSQKVMFLIDTMHARVEQVSQIKNTVEYHGITKKDLESLSSIIQNRLKAQNKTLMINFNQLVHIHAKEGISVLDKREINKINARMNNYEDSFGKSIDALKQLIDIQTNRCIKDIEGRLRNAKQVTIYILFGMSLFAVLFALVFSRMITHALRKLKDSAAYIGEHDFYFDPGGYPNDEIGDLANAFFDMSINLKKKEEELVKSKRLAAIGEIAASVNHEINNPLMIISGNAQFLEMSLQDAPEDVRERVKTISEEAERISQVTQKLRNIKNPVSEQYTSQSDQMINLDKSSRDETTEGSSGPAQDESGS